nr:transposase [Methylovulum miyakonense]
MWARVEHIFRIIKCQFGFRKNRYRGLAKNASQVSLLVGLANLYLLRRPLMAV